MEQTHSGGPQGGPLDTIANLTAAINRGDIGGMLRYFESEAVLVVQAMGGQAGQTARGHAAIREAYAGFFALKPALTRVAQKIIESGPIALHVSRWTLNVTGPDGKSFERSATSADVLRKQSDGTWRVLIYNPYGTDMV